MVFAQTKNLIPTGARRAVAAAAFATTHWSWMLAAQEKTPAAAAALEKFCRQRESSGPVLSTATRGR